MEVNFGESVPAGLLDSPREALRRFDDVRRGRKGAWDNRAAGCSGVFVPGRRIGPLKLMFIWCLRPT